MYEKYYVTVKFISNDIKLLCKAVVGMLISSLILSRGFTIIFFYIGTVLHSCLSLGSFLIRQTKDYEYPLLFTIIYFIIIHAYNI